MSGQAKNKEMPYVLGKHHTGVESNHLMWPFIKFSLFPYVANNLFFTSFFSSLKWKDVLTDFATLQSLLVPDLFLLSASWSADSTKNQLWLQPVRAMNKTWRVCSHPLPASVDPASSRAEGSKGHGTNVPINSITVIISQCVYIHQIITLYNLNLHNFHWSIIF